MKKAKPRWKFLVGVVTALLLLNVYYLFTTPTNEGPWLPVYEQLAASQTNENLVTIENVRRARYDAKGQVKELVWQDRNLDLTKLESVWYGISVFASPGLAHTFLSFDFGDGDPLVISVEARMRPGQGYHPLTGMLDAYHLIYVVADERDVIGVRTHSRAEEVYFMPIKASKERLQILFLDMFARIKSLKAKPEFYNSFTSNCTNSIMKLTKVPAWQYYFDPRIILPGYSDRIAYSYGVLDQNYSLEALREAARLDPKDFSVEDPGFHNKIRASFYDKLKAAAEKNS